MLVKAWEYKTETITPIYFENYIHGKVEKKVYDHRNLLLYNKYFLENNKRESLYYTIYTYDREGNKKNKEYFEDNNKTESCKYSYDKKTNKERRECFLDNNKTAKVFVKLRPFKVIENKYDKKGRVVFKRIETVIKDENSSKSRQTIILYSYDRNSNIVKKEKLDYLGTYSVTLNAQDKIIARERAKDYDRVHRHSHFITYRKYDERGNKIEESGEALRGNNIIPMVTFGANKIEYFYNKNNDLVKAKAPNRCTMIKERTYSYIYSNEWHVE